MSASQNTRQQGGDRGAKGSRLSWRDRIGSYTLHHRTTVKSTLQKLRAEGMQTAMTTLVVAIALLLPAALFVVTENVQQLGDNFDSSAQITVFVAPGAKKQAIEQLQDKLEQLPGVVSVDYISSAQALQSLSQQGGFGNALAHLAHNPLPAVLILQPLIGDPYQSGAQVAMLASTVRQMALVDEVQLDMQWLQRLNQILMIVRRMAMALAVALSLGVLLVVGNTIGLAIESRRDEIVVVKLVGGTDGWVRRPFLYTGIFYGLGGALLTLLMLALLLWWFEAPVARLSALYQSRFVLHGLGVSGQLSLLVIGPLLGLLGAFIAVGRHLRQIEPR